MGPDGKTDGAVLMLIDIDAAKRGLDFAEAIVETVREPLAILNQNLQVMQAKKAFYDTFRAPKEETEGRLIYVRNLAVARLVRSYVPRQAPTRMRWTRSAFSRTSSLIRGNIPMKTPSLGLMLSYAVRKACSTLVTRPAARILNAKHGFVVARMTLYMRGGSLCR